MIETLIFDALKALVNNRVYPDVAPQNTVRPYLTYQQVGGVAVNFVDQTIPSQKNGRWQINVWSNSAAERASLARLIEDSLRVAPTMQATVLSAPISVYEPDTRLYGAHQYFSIWF
jgi:hypothetical protein